MAMLPAYDDGSSTESEYYFDPLEEKQEEAAYAWAHALDAVPIKQEPNEEATEAFAPSKAPSESSEELTLPQGSEWSHGAVVIEHSDLVERALAMASHFEQAKQKEEATTADTVNERSASPVKTSKKTEMRTLKKQIEVKVTQKVVSLKAVKATPPTVRTKSVAVGLMQPRKDEGLQTELERGLSVPRTTRTTTASLSSDSHKREGSPKTARLKENGEEKEPPKRIEQKKKSPSRGKHVSRSPSSYRVAHSKSQPRRHARSPSTRRVERPSRTERSHSPARSYSRRSRSRSPSRRQVERPSRMERSKPQASHFSRRSRSASRSPSCRRGEDRRMRSRSPYRSTSPRHRYDPQRRHDDSNLRNRSPSRVSRSCNSMNGRYRSRSRDHDRYDHRHDSRPEHYDGIERKSVQTSTHSRDLNPRRPSYRAVSSDKRSHSVARLRGASTPRLQEPEPVERHQRLSVQVAPSTANPAPGAKRSPRDPRIRPRVEASTAPNGTARVDAAATPQPAKRFKKSSYIYHDAFERGVFRLKLQEAHLDQMLAAAQGRLILADQRFHESRRRTIDVDRARLQAENFERFEKLYSTTEIRPSDLQRYEGDRNFAKRVVQFKKKQASLQEQKDLFLSTKTRDELWRRLDEDREQLLQENSVMFHKIMMDPHQGGPKHDRGAPFSNGQANERFAMGTSPANLFDSVANSRVVVGASLQVQEHGLPRSFGSRRARVVNAPWFLKG